MDELLKLLECDTIEGAREKIVTLSTMPIAVTLVGTASGGFSMGIIGDTDILVVENLLKAGLATCAQLREQAGKERPPD